jgi:hypothetical protein
VGWGTQITFRGPVAENVPGLDPAYPIEAPGSWFHIPLPSTLTTFGRRNPHLKSITLLFDAQHCRVLHVHVYDGFDIVQEFNDFKLPRTTKLAGEFSHKRNSEDVNPEVSYTNPQEFRNTLQLEKPHKVFSAIGISFYACAFFEDFNVDDHVHNPRFDGPFPESILTVSAAGGQFTVEDNSLLALSAKTISTYRTRLLEKMNMKTNAELTHYAIQNSLV